jgi:hypothetical protein
MPPTAGGGVDRLLTMNSSRRPRRGTRRKPPPFSRAVAGCDRDAAGLLPERPRRIMDQVSPPDESAEPSCRAGVQSRSQRYPLGETEVEG